MNPGLLDHDSALDHHSGRLGPNLFEFPYFRYLATKRAVAAESGAKLFSQNTEDDKRVLQHDKSTPSKRV